MALVSIFREISLFKLGQNQQAANLVETLFFFSFEDFQQLILIILNLKMVS